jgi:hypothetical protein
MTGRYFIVNPHGTIHEVDQAHAEARINDDPRWRMATKAEVELYLNTDTQSADAPLAAPYVPKGQKRVVVKPNG